MVARLPRSRWTALVVATALALIAPHVVFSPTADARDPEPGADFDGDNRADIFWYGSGTAKDSLWLGRGRSFAAVAANVDGVYEPFAGDFNGDGRTDIFWYGPGTAKDTLWLGNPGGSFSYRAINVNGTYEPLVGDFNGDGRDDIFWYSPSGSDGVWFGHSSGDFLKYSASKGSGYQPFVGDFNGDGRDDIFWYRPGSATDHLDVGRSDRTFGQVAVNVGGTYEPLVGDYDGDGRDDIMWYGAGTATDSLWFGNANSVFAMVGASINGTYEPFVGDFDGDGRSDIFWYGPGTAKDSMWMGNGRGFRPQGINVNGDYRPIVGDYDGDHRADILWYGVGSKPDSLWSGAPGAAFVPTALNIGGTYEPIVLSPVARSINVVPVAPGARGEAVVRLQKKLRELNFFVPRTNGHYDAITSQAVMAFQKHFGLGRDGVAGPATVARMNRAAPARALEGGNHVEISIARQTLITVRNGETLVFNTSTGRPGADTPRGRFIMSRQINGMRYAPLGQLWRPKYFNGGIALHGSPSIPAYNASSGCARLHNEAINHIWDAGLVPIGTPVWVH